MLKICNAASVSGVSRQGKLADQMGFFPERGIVVVWLWCVLAIRRVCGRVSVQAYVMAPFDLAP